MSSTRRVCLPIVAALALGLLATLLPLPIGARTANAQSPVVVINEFVANNENGLPDNTGAFEDWIELHNTSGSAVNLAGWTLADGSASHTFGSLSIAGNGYVVLIASNDVSRTTASEVHLPFKLSADGEPLSLRDAAGTLSTPTFPAPGFPALPIDVSYGRSGNTLAYFTSPTPGSSNTGPSSGIVEPVTFSVPHGFYSSAQSVVLTTSTPGATIRYTLDASTPTPTSGTVLSPGQPITISQTSTVRAIAYRTGWIPSTTETRSYFFTADIVNQGPSPSGWPADRSVNGHRFDYGMDPDIVGGNQSGVANSLTAIPTLSIVTDQANLTDGTTGIYSNPGETGSEWERPVSVELIDPSGAEPGFEINAGLRIRGGGSRNVDNPKHSLRLYFRDDYGDGDLEYEVFGPGGVDRFESFGLATGQNGSWQYRGENDATWIRDVWVRQTTAAMGQPDTDSRFFHLYLNGIYWGIYVPQERLSGSHGEEHFGGSEDDYDVISSSWRSAATASDGSIDDWASLYSLVGDLNVTDAEFATLDAQVNLENLAVYYLSHFFTGERDGSPAAWGSNGSGWRDSNNWRAFRNRNGVGDAGKWLVYEHDSEFTLCALGSNVDIDNTDWNLMTGTVPNHQVPTPAWLHEALVTHPAYRQIFRDQVAAYMLTPGAPLTASAGQALVDQLAAELGGAVLAESARWGDSLGDPAHTVSDWQANVSTFRTCIADRFSHVQTQLQADGLWPSEDPPVLSPVAGAVPYGSDVTIDANGQPGSIYYTTDGSDPRGTNGQPAPSATSYTGPLQVTAATTVRARVLDGSSWTPLAEASYSLSTAAGPTRIVLNEYNAVSGSRFLGGGAAGDVANGSDATFGRAAGNGGDWAEFVVLEELDIRGWTFEFWHLDNGLLELSAALEVSSAAPSSLLAGTILTISEDIADDITVSPATGDWHVNLQANAAGAGAYFTPASQQNFATDNDDTQIAVFDSTGAPVMLRTGEGTVAGVSVNSEEVFKLEATPTPAITFDSADYNDGTSSTWGLPNVWANSTITQDLSGLRIMMGDVSCDSALSIADAVIIAQYTVGLRTPVSSCPMNFATEILLPAGDMNNTGSVTVADAVIVAQCLAGIDNGFCSVG